MLNAPSTISNSATMSSLEIAELTGKEHRNVMRDIRMMLGALHGEEGMLSFEHTYTNPQNAQVYAIFLLPKDVTLCLMAGYDVKARMTIIKRWQELEAKEQKPVANLSDASTLRELLLGYTEQVIELKATVEAQKPAVAFHAAVKSSVNSQTVEEVAKTLGTGRNRLYQILRQAGLLKPDNLPYQEFINRGYFELETRTYKDKHSDNNIYHVTMVTGKGFDYIHGKFF